MDSFSQIDLFDSILDTLSQSDTPISNQDLYSGVATRLNLNDKYANLKSEVGQKREKHNLFHRKVRWVLQSLKHKKLVTNVSRGMWEVLNPEKNELTTITPEHNVLAASTSMGIVIWTQNRNIFNYDVGGIDEFHAMITSPPYPLKTARAYGNPSVSEYVDFICLALEPIIPKMALGGSICLNVSNDIFMSKSPARSTYWMKLSIALEERLGLHFMDDIIWGSNKIPGPTMWCCKNKIQLKHGYEHCLWFSNSPKTCFANNSRVLKPHTASHKKFIENGGTKRNAVNGDGAYLKKNGDFSNPKTDGTIPYNNLYFSNYCSEGRSVKRYAESIGITPHSAKMPLSLADFLVKFLTRPGDLIVDLFAGTLTTGQAAENNGRHWVAFEMMLEYIVQGFHRFRDSSNQWINPKLLNIGDY